MNSCSPYEHALNSIRWQIFCGLTFNPRRTRHENQRSACFKNMLQKATKCIRVHPSDLLWLLKQEHGSIEGNCHFHALIAGLPLKAVNTELSDEMEAIWREKTRGTAMVEIYNPDEHGLHYLLKHENQSGRFRDDRESSKFGPNDCPLLPSVGLRRHLKLPAETM